MAAPTATLTPTLTPTIEPRLFNLYFPFVVAVSSYQPMIVSP
jgi:hypothetical protein